MRVIGDTRPSGLHLTFFVSLAASAPVAVSSSAVAGIASAHRTSREKRRQAAPPLLVAESLADFLEEIRVLDFLAAGADELFEYLSLFARQLGRHGNAHVDN
jgi:hypothetical protein